MPESRSHRQRKTKDAGLTGKKEVRLPSGRRVDVVSPTKIATEIERGGKPQIIKSVGRLKEALRTGEARKARMRVPEQNIETAYKEMRRQRVGGQLTNLGGTKKIHVPKRKK